MKHIEQRIEALRYVLEDQRQRIAAGPNFKQYRNEHSLSFAARCLEWTKTAKVFYEFTKKQLAALERQATESRLIQ